MKLSIATSQSLPAPENIHRFITSNGITVLTRSNFNSPSVVISGYLQSGSIFDPDPLLGLADFTASMLNRGTHSRDFHTLHDSLESCGAGMGFSAGVHTTSFSARCLAEDLPLLLDLLSDCLINPAFDSQQVEKLRAQLLTGIAIRDQDTSDMASLAFNQILFAGHPYSRQEDGTAQTISAITRDDLAQFHQKHYGPAGMVIAIVGSVHAEKVESLIKTVFETWQNPSQPVQPPLPPFTPLTTTLDRHVHLRDKSQSDIILGTAAPARTHPDYIPVSLGNNILGQFGMMGRIGEVVRTRSGLAYYAYSSIHSGIGPGSWEVCAGVNPSNVRKAIALIKKELALFVKAGVTVEELSDNQQSAIGHLPIALETNAGVANALVSIERYNLGLDYYLKYTDLIRSVTVDQVFTSIKSYLNPHALAIAVAGK